jgi:hypothetical protein
MFCINLPQDRNKWRVFKNTVKNISALYNIVKFLSSCKTEGGPRRAPPITLVSLISYIITFLLLCLYAYGKKNNFTVTHS